MNHNSLKILMILTLIKEPAIPERIAANAFHKAKEYYDRDRISDMYIKMYHTVINETMEKTLSQTLSKGDRGD